MHIEDVRDHAVEIPLTSPVYSRDLCEFGDLGGAQFIADLTTLDLGDVVFNYLAEIPTTAALFDLPKRETAA